MDRQEFLKVLRQTLAGEVSAETVNENLNYYNDYIVTEMRKGRSESEVLQSLGDPRLIAKTIIDTHGTGNSQAFYAYDEQGTEEVYEERSGRMFRLPGWAMLLLVLVAAFVVVGAASSVVVSLLPIIVPVACIVYLVKMFRR
ncbi:DUF1700 domain-containing protein [bacterium C-53]|nr:DUF1700 domain-containing protein [Lachnospiraceae bacterium]NBI01415.1 DUF1700 domain-containing protein [Lachnospiraceae bacterium]RKJ12728.1 DUF1700 domain-containing protein [bacterium C-53]